MQMKQISARGLQFCISWLPCTGAHTFPAQPRMASPNAQHCCHFIFFLLFLHVSHGFALGDISLQCAGCGCYGVPCTALPNCGCQSRRHRFASLHRCAAVMQSSLRPLHDTRDSYMTLLQLISTIFNFSFFQLQPLSLTIMFAVPISRGMSERGTSLEIV